MNPEVELAFHRSRAEKAWKSLGPDVYEPAVAMYPSEIEEGKFKYFYVIRYVYRFLEDVSGYLLLDASDYNKLFLTPDTPVQTGNGGTSNILMIRRLIPVVTDRLVTESDLEFIDMFVDNL